VNIAPIRPAERFVVAGKSAIAELIRAFAGKNDLDWAEQVTVIATLPSARQMAAAAGAILRSTKATRIIAAGSEELDAEHGRLKGKGPRVVTSSDAGTLDLATANRVAGTA
jgi:hypothetical protein